MRSVQTSFTGMPDFWFAIACEKNTENSSASCAISALVLPALDSIPVNSMSMENPKSCTTCPPTVWVTDALGCGAYLKVWGAWAKE